MMRFLGLSASVGESLGFLDELRKIKEDRQVYKDALAEEREVAVLKVKGERAIELREKARARAEFEALPLSKKAQVYGGRVRDKLKRVGEKFES